MTVGRTIWFGDGAFAPDTRSGRETLRHEVVHALQQSGIRRGMGRGKARMGTPSAPAVQCLMSSADVKIWGGSPGASIRGKKRYSKILSKLDAWHGSRNTRQRARLLKEMETLVDAFIKANGGTRDAVKERKLSAVRDLKAQIAHERGDTTERSTFDKVNRAREQVRQTGLTGLPDTAVTGTKYIFKMHSHIGHKRYTALAKKRASLTRDETLKFWKKTGDKKSSRDIKREAAKSVADEYTGDWDKETFTDRERAKAKRDFVETLIDASGNVGHAWVSFETENREGAVTAARSFGFWPHYAATHFKDAVPGNVHHPDDRYDGRGNTRSKRHEVSFPDWKRGITACYDTLRSPPAYQLLGTNCTTFTRDIARATNVTFPNAFWIAPDLSWIWNPNDLYDTFED